jgi:hypothetical protein
MISAEANTSAKHNQHTPDSRVALEIAGLLFASTVINYIDRQTLSLLAPYLKPDYHWTNSFFSFAGFRFLLGAGESANWPAATKAVRSGFQAASGPWQRPYLIAAPPSAARLLPSSFFGFIFVGAGVQLS